MHEQLIIVLAVFSLIVEGMVRQSELEPLGDGDPYYHGREPTSDLSENVSQAQEADVLAGGAAKFQHIAHLANQGAKEQLGQYGELQQRGGATVQTGQSQMAFPGFENDFNAPAQSVDRGQGLGWPDRGGHIGQQEIPAHQEQVLLAWRRAKVAPGVGPGSVPAQVGHFFGHRQGDQAHRHPLCPQQELEI